jgi:hypothetical protein
MATQAGQLNRAYVSAIDFMDQREIMNKMLDIWDDEATIVDIMEATGRYVQTSQETFHYHVNTRLHASATVNAIEAAPAAGAATDVVLTAGSVKPRLGDIMLTPGGYRSLVTAVVTDTITVKPLNSASIAHEALAVNDKVTFFSNAYAEGTGANPGYIYGSNRYSNNIQIIKGDFSVTDLQAKTKVEVEFEGKPYYFIKGINDAFNRFKMDIAYSILLGEKSASLTDQNSKAVLTTQGLEKSIRGNGVVLPLDQTSYTTFQTTFRLFNRGLDQARGPKEYWMWNGADISNYFDDWLTQLTGLTAGGISYNSFGKGDAKKKAVDLGFNSWTMYDRTFHKKKLDALDNPQITAATNFKYPNMMFLIPANKVKCNHDGETKDRFRIRYIASPADPRIMQEGPTKYLEILTGGLAPNPTSKEAKLDVTYTTWQGPEFLGLEHFGITQL